MVFLNKKGTITDIIYISVIIFIVALAGLIFLTMSNNVYPKLLNTSLAENPAANATMRAARDFSEARTDYMITGIIILLLIALLVFAYIASASFIFIVIYIVLLIVAGVLAGIFQFAWEKITESSTLAAGLANLPMVDFILSNFLTLMVVVGIISLVLMYIGYNSKGGNNG